MPRKIVEHLVKLESEADRIVADAQRRAAELQQSVKGKMEARREERQKAFEGEMKSFQEELKRRTASEIGEIDRKARDISNRLESLDPKATEKAMDIVLAKLREG